MWRFVLIALSMFTLDQIRSAECRVACRFTGTEGGVYWKANCYCFNVVDYSEIVNRQRIYIPKKAKTNLVPSSYSDPPKEPEPELHRGYPKELDDYLF